MTQVRTPGHIRIVLPGAWVNVPLASAEASRSFAQRAVRQQVGRDDRLARVRRDAVQQMCDLADQARALGAHTLAMALEIAPGVPFSASLVCRDVPWPDAGGDTGPEEDAAPAARLARAFPGSELRELPAGPASRQQGAGVLRGKEEQMTSVDVAYRIPRPDSDQLLNVRFTAPDLGRPDVIVELFDAIVGSIEFTRRRLGAVAPGPTPPLTREDSR